MKFPERPSRQGKAGGRIDALFVSRLERLIRLRGEYREDLNPLGLRLLDRAIYSTYRDCIDYGAEVEAKVLMAKHPDPNWHVDHPPEREERAS
jgi:hypothetical protein